MAMCVCLEVAAGCVSSSVTTMISQTVNGWYQPVNGVPEKVVHLATSMSITLNST